MRVLREEDREPRDHDRCDDRGSNIEFLQRDDAAQQSYRSIGAFRQIQLLGDHHLRLAAEYELAEPDEEIGQSERRHEQDDVGLIDQRTQYRRVRPQRRARTSLRWSAPSARNAGTPTFVEADQRQRGKHHHDALRKIEYAGGLEYQHEAKRDQRIEHAADQFLPTASAREGRAPCPSARRDR